MRIELTIVDIHIRLDFADACRKRITGNPHGKIIDLGRRRRLHGQISVICPRFRRPHRRQRRLGDTDIRLRFDIRHRHHRDKTLEKIFRHPAQRRIIRVSDSRLLFRLRLCLRTVLIAQAPLCPGARRDIDIIANDGISFLAIRAHFDLGIRAVADIPIPKLGLGRRMNRDIPGILRVLPLGRNRRIIHINACDTHRRAHRRHFDISRFFGFRRRINVRIFNDEIAAILRGFRGIRLQFCFCRSHRHSDISAAGLDIRTGYREIIKRLGTDVPTGRCHHSFRREISPRRERNPAGRDRRHRRRLDALRIQKRRAIRSLTREILERRTRVNFRTRIQRQRPTGRRDDRLGCIRRTGKRNISPFILQNEIQHLIGALSRRRFVKFVRVNLDSARRLPKQRFPESGIRPQRQPSHIKDACRTDSNSAFTEEIHIASNFIVFERIHHAVDIDLGIDDIDLMRRLAHMEIRDIRRAHIELAETIERRRLIRGELLILDVILRPAPDRLRRHRIAVLGRILHDDIRPRRARHQRAENAQRQRRPHRQRRTILFPESFHRIHTDPSSPKNAIEIKIYDSMHYLYLYLLL